ncbi:MAG: peptide ABC transporter substrate-binding protein [Candidatus Wallbacteria bacterium HGW-Wallbacteria-1]|jgi:oligopeptide/dipeptide ABC transporter ATP-binding protein|uniref:Peptide ABC transporter substrate-binding protein n=1 Tax=Candidatus Wallbacteria bacterium HGW-Wallbacteria-1 TaxID=2013854 RepID=A0A2N1PT75_9BACT|nr:MAG: peptide ABC transporter substrate-binding protein [Candidatus Wallbacteria bacterium HGW-Wallbacteria-1]
MSKTKTTDNKLLLEVNNLKMHFPVFGGVFRRRVGEVKAVDGISFNLTQGETLGLVGESGCGKSTTGKCLINLNKATAGEIIFHSKQRGVVEIQAMYSDRSLRKVKTFQVATDIDVDVASLNNNQMRPFRSEIQMIFQDPYSSLNPRMTVGDIICEPMDIHCPEMTKQEKDEKVHWLLDKVGLRQEHASRYPHEFSGGQRQRIGIARALSTNPRLIIADEPVSALDVSVQAQVINLMQDLQKEFGLTYIFIAHDLAVVEHISDRIAVMYLGNIVEIAKSAELYANPCHPYTRALLSAIPVPDPRHKKTQRVVLQGDVPTPLNKPSGCGFRTRCPIAKPQCALKSPPLIELGPDHLVACPYHSEYKM